ncbi:MAG TPA: transporter associated domain-containing protein, partial [Ktedonobacteraceae bacterium]|nr:transporter associated domain-containing protein [Ktedonobacteraceae bacterium]
VGDIQDEYDREEKLYERVSEKEYIFNAKISINEFNALMYLDLDDRDYETLGGFLYAQLDKIPVVDDSITYNQMRFTVLTTRGRRITRIRVELESGALPPVESLDANQDEHEHMSDPQNIASARPLEEQGQATTGSQRQLFARRRSRRSHAKHVGNVSFS